MYASSILFGLTQIPFLPRSSAPGGLNVIQKEAWLCCRTCSGVRLCWELEEPQGPRYPIENHHLAASREPSALEGWILDILHCTPKGSRGFLQILSAEVQSVRLYCEHSNPKGPKGFDTLLALLRGGHPVPRCSPVPWSRTPASLIKDAPLPMISSGRVLR